MENSKKQNNKRTKTHSDSDEEPCGVETFPRFMVIQSTDPTRPVAALSPFVIEKSISSSIGTPKSVKKLKSGCLLVECERRGQADNIMRMKTFFDVPVTSFAHTTLNSSKGVSGTSVLTSRSKVIRHKNTVSMAFGSWRKEATKDAKPFFTDSIGSPFMEPEVSSKT
jgi:hypothetical protein